MRRDYQALGRLRNHFYADTESLLPMIAALPQLELGYLTSQTPPDAWHYLRHYELDAYFNKVYCTSRPGCACTKRTILTHVLGQNTSADKHVIWISDDPEDIRHGHRIGIYTAGITYGRGRPDAVRAEKPEYVIETPQEILRLIQSLAVH
jgi:phosphoglycolate phosphatase-like HAD superfamily hydrolase